MKNIGKTRKGLLGVINISNKIPIKRTSSTLKFIIFASEKSREVTSFSGFFGATEFPKRITGKWSETLLTKITLSKG